MYSGGSKLRSPTLQSFIEEHRSVDLNTSIDITDDTSLTLVSIPDTDINDIDNNSGNIATRVRAKNEKARKNTVHEKSQHFNTLNIYISTHTSNIIACIIYIRVWNTDQSQRCVIRYIY